MATLTVTISSEEHNMDNRETVMKLLRVPYIVPKSHELWSTNG